MKTYYSCRSMRRQATRKSDEVIKIARTMDNTMDFNGLSSNAVEDKA